MSSRAVAAESAMAAADSAAVQDSLVTTAAPDTVSQRDVFDILDRYIFKKRVEPQYDIKARTGLQWSLLPTIGYNPVYGVAVGALVQGAGRRGTGAARYSRLQISGNVSTTGQIQLQVRGDVFSPGETYLSKLDFRYLDTERSTWGLGPINAGQVEDPMTFVLDRIYATVLRRVSGPVFLGIGFHYDEFSDIVDENAEMGDTTSFAAYSGGLPSTTRAVGLSIDVLNDTRDNLLNPRRGYYLNFSFRDYLKALTSDENWQELWVEVRVYPHLPARSEDVLAFWAYGWMTYGPAPYLNLPANGWDTYGRGARGYLAGRIRGLNQIYLESEYRRSLARDGLLGAVVFLNGTATTDTDTGTFGRMDYGAGAGLRLKFNKRSATNLTIDYGWGREGSHYFYLGMGEVF